MKNFLAAILAAGSMAAETPDPVDLMRRSSAVFEQNRQRAVNYLYREVITNRQIGRKARVLSARSRTFEILYIEGESYQRMVGRNGSKLPKDEQEFEDRNMQRETARRRGKTLEERRAERRPERDRAQIAYDRIADLHDIRFEGEEEIGGRPAYVVTAEPRQNVALSSEVENYTHSLRLKLWIDRDTLLFHRIEAVSTRAAWRRPAGNILRIDFVPFDSQVWLVQRILQRMPVSTGDNGALFEETEQSYSDYRKFQADSKLVSIEEHR